MVGPTRSTARRTRKPPRKVRIARKMTRFVKPCVFYKETETPKGDKLLCEYDHSRRNRCRTVNCPHFRPTVRYRIARRFRMVR